MIVIQYTNDDERDQIIREKTEQGLVLKEYRYFVDGNFLGFVDPNDLTTIEKVEEIANENAELKQAIAELTLMLATTQQA